jgi:hypothetical protein
MTYHQSSAVSVAIALTATIAIITVRRLGRPHSTWRKLHEARQALRTTRQDASAQTIQIIAGAVIVLAALFAAAFTAAR